MWIFSRSYTGVPSELGHGSRLATMRDYSHGSRITFDPLPSEIGNSRFINNQTRMDFNEQMIDLS